MAGIFRIDRINWNAILLCFLAATIFWLFSALNQDHVTELKVPLQLSLDETSFAETAKQPSNIRIKVESKGWTLLAKTLGWQRDALSLTIDDPVAKPYILVTSEKPLIEAVIGDLRILEFLDDTVHLSFDRKKRKKIYLRADMSEARVKQGFAIFETAVIKPDTVTISGPGRLVDQMADTFFVKPVEKRISGKFSKAISINLPDRIQASTNEVLVTFEAVTARLVEKMVPLRIEQGTLRRKSKGIPNNVHVQLLIPEEMNPALLAAGHAILSVNVKGPTQQVPVLVGFPEKLRVVQVDTVNIQ